MSRVYEVDIQVTLTDTVMVEADNPDEAEAKAREEEPPGGAYAEAQTVEVRRIDGDREIVVR